MEPKDTHGISDRIALVDVPALLPRRKGRRVHYSTVFRWSTKGARGRVLETHLVGGVRYTTAAALNRFLDGEVTITVEQHDEDELHRLLYGEQD